MQPFVEKRGKEKRAEICRYFHRKKPVKKKKIASNKRKRK